MADQDKFNNLWTLGATIVLFVGYILFSLGKESGLKTVFAIVGILLAVYLIAQAGIIQYFKKENYKSLGLGDIVVFGTLIIAGAIIINSVMFFPSISGIIPVKIANFATTNAIILAVIGIVLAIIHYISARFN